MQNNRITIKEAADLLGLAQQTLRIFLQHGKFSEFGYATKTSSKWTYYINRKALLDYLRVKEPTQVVVA